MWIGAGVGTTTIVASTDVLVGVLSAAALLLRPFTILRTHLYVTINSDQAAATERLIATIGSIVVTDTAAALGITALPDPSGIAGDPEADWFVWQALIMRFEFFSGAGFQNDAFTRYDIDSKAMRKVGPDDQVATILANDSSVGGELVTQGRRLIQLH